MHGAGNASLWLCGPVVVNGFDYLILEDPVGFVWFDFKENFVLMFVIKKDLLW